MLVDIDTAKRHLRRDDNYDDERIALLIDQASEIMIDYLKLPEGTYQATDGSPDDVPRMVEAATLLVIESMYDRPEVDPLTEAVRSILHRSRDPAIA